MAAATAVLAVSTPALSADIPAEPEPLIDGNFWYVSIHGGIKFGEDWDDDWSYGDLEFEVDNGWRVGGTIGYSLSSIFAVEGELSYMHQELEPDQVTLAALAATEDCCNDSGLSIVTGMINLVGGVLIGNRIRPYAGAGMGLAHVSLNNVDLPTAFDLDDSDVVLAAQGFVGLDVVVSERFAIGARYRLLHLGDVELEDDGHGEHDLDPDLIHSVEAVFTVGF
jgi:opacity protein-like surface antigen